MRTPPRFALVLFWALFHATSGFAVDHFYRIIDGPNPGPRQVKIDRYIYGADVLYTGDAKVFPTHVEGTVWHAGLSEAKYFVGTHNPVIEQPELLKLIENDKWEEAKIMMAAAPDAYPKTENLGELLNELKLSPSEISFMSPTEVLEKISAKLRERYPDGYFMKPVAGFNSAGTFPTEKTDFASVYKDYLKNVKPQIEKRLEETHGDTSTVHLELKHLKNYSGRVLEDLLKQPDKVIVQAKVKAAIGSVLQTPEGPKPLIDEYRVHVFEGKVKKGLTQTRWEDARNVDPEAFARVDAFAQRIINSLPAKMRKMSDGMDVIRTENGLYQIIELNPGGDSGYLYPDTDLWAAQQLAAHYGGKAPVLSAFKKFKEAATLEAKEAALEKLLKRPELKTLTKEVSPVTELLAQSKDVFMEKLYSSPSKELALRVTASLKKFKLDPYLTSKDISFLGTQIVSELSPGAGFHGLDQATLASVRGTLGLSESEHLFFTTEGELHLLNGISYDDRFVQEELLKQAKSQLRDAGKPLDDPALLRETLQELINDKVVLREQLATHTFEAESLARDAGAIGEGARMFYTGTREALFRTVIEEAFRR